MSQMTQNRHKTGPIYHASGGQYGGGRSGVENSHKRDVLSLPNRFSWPQRILKSEIRAMINRSKNAVFEHHSRNYGVPSSSLRMLPVLTKDPASTEWFSGLDE
jgi:hypothetical protein